MPPLAMRSEAGFHVRKQRALRKVQQQPSGAGQVSGQVLAVCDQQRGVVRGQRVVHLRRGPASERTHAPERSRKLSTGRADR